MEKKILITYATIHGSTREIAEDINKVLTTVSAAGDLLPAGKVRTLEPYSGVILGAPLFMFHLHKDGLNFLSRFRRELEGGLPIAVFAGGPTGKAVEEEWKMIREQFATELAKFPWLKPASTLLVGGRFDPNNLRLPWSLLPALRQMPAVDYRDWPAIEAWAESLPAIFAGQSLPEGLK